LVLHHTENLRLHWSLIMYCIINNSCIHIHVHTISYYVLYCVNMFWNFKKQLWLVTNSGKCKFTNIRQNVCHNRVSEWLLFKWAIYHLDIMPRTSYVLMRWWWWWWWCWCLFCTRLTRVGLTIMLDHWSNSQHVDMSLKIQR
jgi:hypothetical protein